MSKKGSHSLNNCHSNLAGIQRADLDRFYSEVVPDLVRFLRCRLGNRADVDEIAQEACLRLCLADLENGVRNRRAFLHRAARNLVADFYRRKFCGNLPRENLGLDSDQSSQETGNSVEEVLFREEQIAALVRVIGELPQRCKQVFVMHRLKEKTQRQVSRELGISRQMVERHVAKGLERCRERMNTLYQVA